MKLTKCFACFSGYGCSRKQRLPRNKKKSYKKFYEIYKNYFYQYFMEVPSSCDIGLYYKEHKALFKFLPFINKYKNEINFLRSELELEGVYFDNNGRLSWYWEYDCDYSPSSGLMPFCYNEKDAGKTWAFSELQNFIQYTYFSEIENEDFVFPIEIVDDKSLLEFIKNNKPC